jgi:probable rRNA maturation factor
MKERIPRTDKGLSDNSVEYSFKNVRKEKWIVESIDYCYRLLKKLNISNWEVSVLFCDDDAIRELNRTYRGKDKPTDVLAFRQDDDNNFPNVGDVMHFAGDIVISIDTLKCNSDNLSIKKELELKRLLTHAILHLQGMDHKKKNDPMLRLQEQLIEELENQKEEGYRKSK